MNNYTYVTEKLIDLEIAPKNANNLEELIQQTRENIRNKQYLVDEIKEVFSLYDKIEKTNEFVLNKNNFFNDNNNGTLFDDGFFDSIREDKITREFLTIKEKNILDENELEEKETEIKELWYDKTNIEMYESLTHDEIKDYIEFIKNAIDQILEDINDYFYNLHYEFGGEDFLNKTFEN